MKEIQMTLSKKLIWLIAGSIVITTLFIMAVSAVNIIKQGMGIAEDYRATLISERKNQIKGYIEMATKLIDTLPLDEAKKAVEIMRYGDKGYISLHDYNNIMIVHPDPSLVGRDLTELKDPYGVYIVRELTRIARENEEGGFHSYSWKIPGQENLRPKISFAKSISNYQWIITTGLYTDDIDKSVDRAKSTIKNDIITTIAVQLIIALVIAFILVMATKIFITRHITAPIELVTSTMQRFNNDLTISVPVVSNDEVGSLAEWFNELIGRLHQSMVMLSNITDSLYSHSDTISSNIQTQSGFAAELASSITEITSTMEELSSSASQIAQHSHGVVEQTDKTLIETRKGASEVENLRDKIEHINSNMKANLAEIVSLGDKSKDINKIMEMINNIANQTRLIAFNAALEAASAGEFGKRFGVVAVEIRRLADSVVESTSEIESKIREILDSVNRLVMSSEKTSIMMEQGHESSNYTVEMLMNMVDGVEQAADSARQISLSTQQQQIASSQVLIAIKEIEQGARSSTDSYRKSNLVAEGLAQLSEKLKELVKKFKIDPKKNFNLSSSNVLPEPQNNHDNRDNEY